MGATRAPLNSPQVRGTRDEGPAGRAPRAPRRPAGARGSARADHAGPGEQVVPAAAALVDEDPDIPEVEDGAGDPEADEAQGRGPAADRAAVAVAHDADPGGSHAGRLAPAR